MEWFYNLYGWQQALIATTFTWLLTALGALPVFFCKNVGKNAFSFMMSGAAGIMLASTFFSLLMPALNMGMHLDYLILTIGFSVGGLLIILTDIACDKLEVFGNNEKHKNCAVMCIAVTVHNIPEGLAIGVAFGAIASGGAAGVGALMLAIGIGIQNFPEGMCVAFPLRAYGLSRFKSFFIGQLSGVIEIIAGIVGAITVTFMSGILPFALSFSAGAMVAVVCSELIPESFSNSKIKATIGIIFGFALMMILDIAFG